MSKVDEVQALGYEVRESAQAPKAEDGTDSEGFWTYYAVKGFGVEMVVREDDDHIWDSLLHPEAHEERVQQEGETAQETRERHEAAERERLIAEGKPLGAMEESAAPSE